MPNFFKRLVCARTLFRCLKFRTAQPAFLLAEQYDHGSSTISTAAENSLEQFRSEEYMVFTVSALVFIEIENRSQFWWKRTHAHSQMYGRQMSNRFVRYYCCGKKCICGMIHGIRSERSVIRIECVARCLFNCSCNECRVFLWLIRCRKVAISSHQQAVSRKYIWRNRRFGEFAFFAHAINDWNTSDERIRPFQI